VSNVAREATLAPPAWRPPGNSTTFTIRDFRRRRTHDGKPQADDARSPLSTPLSRSAPTETGTLYYKCPPTARGGDWILVDPSSNLSTRYRFLPLAYISFPELACMPQRYPDPDRGHCWPVFYCPFRNSGRCALEATGHQLAGGFPADLPRLGFSLHRAHCPEPFYSLRQAAVIGPGDQQRRGRARPTRQIVAPICWQVGRGWRGHLLSKGLLHGIRRNRRVSSLSRCRKLRCRDPRGLRYRPIDCLGSLSVACNPNEESSLWAARLCRRGAHPATGLGCWAEWGAARSYFQLRRAPVGTGHRESWF
jgi:hypothetical protein